MAPGGDGGGGKGGGDLLDHAVAFLQRRDGVDKALKLCRYSCKLLLSTALRDSPTELAARLKAFEASVGTSRKAFRLGKFLQMAQIVVMLIAWPTPNSWKWPRWGALLLAAALTNLIWASILEIGYAADDDLRACLGCLRLPQDVNVLRRTRLATRDGLLELVASGGEGLYYFVEQFVWLVKAGALDKRHARWLQQTSAWAEFVGYFASVTLKCIQIRQLACLEGELGAQLQLQEMRRLRGAMLASASNGAPEPEGRDASELQQRRMILSKLRAAKGKRAMKVLSTIQDLADALLALHDIRDQPGLLAHKALLSGAGLLSALISAHKNWVSV
eukprot:SM000058S18526  [mRNA]  locus=s58:298870:300379:- [translate_table: standard]